MRIVQSLSALALRQLLEGGAKIVGMMIAKETTDAVVTFFVRRFTDHSQRLTLALQTANERAWKAVELGLGGDSVWERCQALVAPKEVQAFRTQARAFLENTPLNERGPEFRKQCLRQLRLARKAGLLTEGALEPQMLAERAGAFARFADPAALLAAEFAVIDEMADRLRDSGCDALAAVIAHRPERGAPLLAAAARYFFRRQLEEDRELFQGIVSGQLQSLEAQQEAGFNALGGLLTQHGDRLEEMLGDVQAVVMQTFGDVLDIKGELQRQGTQLQALGQAVLLALEQYRLPPRTLRPGDSLSIVGSGDRQRVRLLVNEFRALPEEERRQAPALQNGIGMLEAAAGDFTEAQREFREAANVLEDPNARAAARHNAFQAAVEQRQWEAALDAYLEAAALLPDRFALFPGAKYEAQRVLGAGGFGVVFQCRHRNSGSRVVVKALRPDTLDRALTDLFREAQVLEELDHPAIVRCRDCDFADLQRGRPFLVMDYFDGTTLSELVTRDGPVSAELLLPLARLVAEAMQAAHVRNILHRDIKPANVLVRRDGAQWRVKLIDFGLALKQQVLNGSLPAKTVTGSSVAGTRDYAAPEQMGQLPGVGVTPRSDLYGFGKTCCYALFRTVQPQRKHWRAVPEALADLLEQCMAETPTERPADFAEVLTRLEAMKAPAVAAPAAPAASADAPFWKAKPAAAAPVAHAPGSPAAPPAAHAPGLPAPGDVRCFVGHTAAVTAVAVSPDGRLAVSAAENVRVWELATGKELRKLEGHTHAVRTLAFTPDGREILSAGSDMSARIWDSATGKQLQCFPNWVQHCAAFSVDGRRMVSGNAYDGMVRLFDLEVGRELRRFKGHATFVRSVAFSLDGRRVISGAGDMREEKGKWTALDCTVRIWDAETGREQHCLKGHAEVIRCVAVSPNGRLIASSGRPVRIWDVATGKQIGTAGGEPHFLGFSTDSRLLLYDIGGLHTINVWTAATQQAASQKLGHQPSALAFTPDGKCALTGGSDDFALRLWRLP